MEEFSVEMCGYGVFRMNGRLWVWDDYPDDDDHDGSGVLRDFDGTDALEIVRWVWEGEKRVACVARPFEWWK